MNITLFDELNISISDEDWNFLCIARFFSDDPPIEDIEAEFVTGTGITPNKPEKWMQASEAFREYVADLRSMNPYIYNPNGISGDANKIMEEHYGKQG